MYLLGVSRRDLAKIGCVAELLDVGRITQFRIVGSGSEVDLSDCFGSVVQSGTEGTLY